jgi:hypothetical protein
MYRECHRWSWFWAQWHPDTFERLRCRIEAEAGDRKIERIQAKARARLAKMGYVVEERLQ